MEPIQQQHPVNGAAQGDDELNLHELLRIVLTHLNMILAVTLIAGGLAIAYVLLVAPTYEASTTVKVPDSSQSMSGMMKELVPYAGGGDPVETFVEVAKSENVAGRVAKTLNLAQREDFQKAEMTTQGLVDALQKIVQVANVKKSNVLSMTAQSKDPQLAADLANAWADAFIAVNLDLSRKGAASKRQFIEEQITQIKERLDSPGLRLSQESKADEAIYNLLLEKLQEARISENVDDSGIVVVDRAVPPEKPVKPKKKRTLLLAMILGLALGIQLAFLLERLRDRVKHEDMLKRVTTLPNYAVVPDFREDYPEGMNPPDPKERFSVKSLINNAVFMHAYYRESFKVLRTNLTLAQAGHPPKAVAVLSPSPEEGKTLVNANLAISLAQSGSKVLLVDADLRKSSVRKIFGIEKDKDVGLPLALTGHGDWHNMIEASGIENLDLLPNSVAPPNPAELLGSAAMKKVLGEMKKTYEFVIFDGAPVLPVTDSVVLSTLLDGVVLMARWDYSRTHEVARALEQLRAVNAPVLGTLLNRTVVKKGLYGYSYGYGYGYGYGKYKYYGSKESSGSKKKDAGGDKNKDEKDPTVNS